LVAVAVVQVAAGVRVASFLGQIFLLLLVLFTRLMQELVGLLVHKQVAMLLLGQIHQLLVAQ
jgi:hypothetical protein